MILRENLEIRFRVVGFIEFSSMQLQSLILSSLYWPVATTGICVGDNWWTFGKLELIQRGGVQIKAAAPFSADLVLQNAEQQVLTDELQWKTSAINKKVEITGSKMWKLKSGNTSAVWYGWQRNGRKNPPFHVWFKSCISWHRFYQSHTSRRQKYPERAAKPQQNARAFEETGTAF